MVQNNKMPINEQVSIKNPNNHYFSNCSSVYAWKYLAAFAVSPILLLDFLFSSFWILCPSSAFQALQLPSHDTIVFMPCPEECTILLVRLIT